MIKSKKQMFIIIGMFTLLLVLTTTTYAFFNYTRTGQANTISVGHISFVSSQSNTINLTNVFPIERTAAPTDNTNSSEVVITITGDTNYTDGIEYLLTAEDVKIETNTHKKVPIGIIVTPEKNSTELGTANANYFNTAANGGRGGSTSYYKVLANDVMKDGDYILVGYIRPGAAEVNGTIGIRAFIDLDEIAISDTYDGTESFNMGTTNNWVNGREVFTTSEWNSLQGNNAISFKIKVQANEGIWVGEPLSRNDMDNIYKVFVSGTPYEGQGSSLTEIEFIRMSQEMINLHSNVVNLTASGGEGVVKAWMDGTKLYVASPGETYFPSNSSGLFAGYSNLITVKFNNVNTTSVVDMNSMFHSCSNLETIDLSTFDTSNVTNMSDMFHNCTSLTSLDLSYLNTSSVQTLSSAFSNCSNLESVNISGIGSNSLTYVGGMFAGCTSLLDINMNGFNFGTANLVGLFTGTSSIERIILRNAITNNVTSMNYMFGGCSSLSYLDLSGINTGNVTNMEQMFQNCTSLTEIDLSSFTTSNVTKMSKMFAMGTYSNNAWTPSNNSLTTIKVGSGWNTNSVTDSTDMFYNCTHLVGGSGTIFSSSYIDKTRAIVDGGTTNPGYLTLKTN